MQSILDYEITEQLYKSANSLIYRASHSRTRQPAVLKQLREEYPSPQKIAGFQREYEITRSFQHAGIIQVFGLEKWRHTWVLIMEDDGCQSLNQWLTANKLDIADFLELAIQIAECLSAVHQQNVIHKDIHPANILLNPRTRTIKLIDFGISTLLSRETPWVVNPNVLEGTLDYISPEQTGRMNRSIDYRSDLYSLGATFYFMLTGTPPFAGSDPLELVHCHIARELSFPPEPRIPEMLQNIIARLMEKTAEFRYQSALSLKHDLEVCLTQWKASQHIPTFSLGQTDRFDQFRIPEKLYGREREIETLLASFERIQTGKSELMLVSGYSGIGKTSLIHEVHKPIVAKRGNYISGKFDQYQRDVPYSVFIQAFQQLLQQILTETETRIQDWKEKILREVGENGQLIVEVLPELELIIGKQNPVIPLPSREARNRFNGCFRNFVSVFATADHPLALFLDDLQWADLSSLKLIELLMTDSDSRFLLMILSWRSNEVDQAHPLLRTLQEMREKQVSMHSVLLEPLDEEHIHLMLTEMFHRAQSDTLPLAQLLLKKTGGNPFFLKQLLNSLHQEGLIEFVPSTLNWEWELSRILTSGISENVVDLMVNQLNRAEPSTQAILKSASVLGRTFDLRLLSLLHRKNMKETLGVLWESLQKEWIIPVDDSWKTISDTESRSVFFSFAHDRIQQSAASLLPANERVELHFTIGQLMRQHWSQEEQEDRLFEMVSHLNQSLPLIQTSADKAQIRGLNLRAAQKAKRSLSYETQFHCLKSAQSLLEKDSWEVAYQETLDIYTGITEAAFYTGNYTEMDVALDEVLKRGQTILDKLAVYLLKSDRYMTESRQLDALRMLLGVLVELGVSFPENPGMPDIQRKMGAVLTKLADIRIEDLADLPAMKDAHKLAAIQIMGSMVAPAYQTFPVLFPLLVLECLEVTLDAGNHHLSSFVYGAFGVLVITVLGEIDLGYRLSILAEQALERIEDKTVKPLSLHGIYAYIRHHKDHLRDSLPGLHEEHSVAMEVSNFEYAALSSYFICTHSLFLGINLSQLKETMSYHIQIMRKISQTVSLGYTEPWLQVTLNLLGNTENPWRLQDIACHETEFLPALEETQDRYDLLQFYFINSLLAYWGQQYREAETQILLAEPYLDAVVCSFLADSLFWFYRCLIALALHDQAEPAQQGKIMEEVETWLNKVKFSADHAPMNNLHRRYLVEAEKARVLGNILEAQEAYDHAIFHAHANEFLNDEAMANELAGQFYWKRGKTRIAGVYLNEAIYLYRQWGANAIVQRMIRDYGNLVELREVSKSDFSPPALLSARTDFTIRNASTQSHSEILDIHTLLKSSQTLSEEILLENLLEKIMRIMVENAGAQKGVLLLKNPQWRIQAVAETVSSTVEVFQGSPLDSEASQSQLPQSMVQYVLRTGQNLVLDHAFNDKRFMSDPYVTRHSLKSVLCEPILHQGQFKAILYLENNLTPGAFTEDRLEMLKMLSSQVAISIENAQLYANLEEKVRERTLQLQQKTEELAERNREMTADLITAAAVQSQLFTGYRTPGFLNIAVRYLPHSHVSGDIYKLYEDASERFNLFLGDSTGHGVAAALSTIMADLLLSQKNDATPAVVMNYLNDHLQEHLPDDRFMSAVLLQISKEGLLTLTNAGHPAVLILPANGENPVLLSSQSMMLGLFQTPLFHCRESTYTLQAGDLGFLYTDGITERVNPKGNLFGEKRLIRFLQENRDRDVEALLEILLRQVDEFAEGNPPDDDISAIAFRYVG
ncbi:MAG: AAA family ATPase [SAR324 cluster bacterium]|nr:AAA family ATPase [SAR324 cluster bacterium]MBF0353544.1 AAA family ATPase [SAR324 cluster bacterium]